MEDKYIMFISKKNIENGMYVLSGEYNLESLLQTLDYMILEESVDDKICVFREYSDGHQERFYLYPGFDIGAVNDYKAYRNELDNILRLFKVQGKTF